MRHIRGRLGRLAGTIPVLLTDRQVRAVSRLWRSGATRDEICRAVGITNSVFRARLADQLAALPRRGRGRGGGRKLAQRDPSPDEIYGRLTLEVQAKWTDEEREERWQGKPT